MSVLIIEFYRIFGNIICQNISLAGLASYQNMLQEAFFNITQAFRIIEACIPLLEMAFTDGGKLGR